MVLRHLILTAGPACRQKKMKLSISPKDQYYHSTISSSLMHIGSIKSWIQYCEDKAGTKLPFHKYHITADSSHLHILPPPSLPPSPWN